MDQLDFLRVKIKELETKYYARVFYEQYKQFHSDGNYGVEMCERKFCQKLHEIDGVSKHKRHGRIMYTLNKSAMQKHLDVLCQEQLEPEDANAAMYSSKRKKIEEQKQKRHEARLRKEEELKRLQEEVHRLRSIEEQAMMEYAHGDSVTRVTIGPLLHRMLESRFPDESKRSEFIRSLTGATIE